LFGERSNATNCRETSPNGGRPKGFASDTEEKTGTPKRETQRAVARAERITPEVKNLIRDMPV
jgi:hypothetical protein